MTSKLTKERLQEIAEDGFLKHGESKELARMALAAIDSEPVIADCDPEVYEKGVSVCLLAIPKETAEIICQNITAATGCKVDWHYFGGRVHIKALRESSQPAPEYPEVLPCPVLLEPGLRFGKGIKTSTMLAAMARRAVYESDMAELSPEERAEFQAGIEDFKALIAQPAPVVPAVSDDIGEIRVGRLPTMNQDDYPGLGDWWVQLRIGEDSDEVLARVYGATPQEANNRAEALACRAAMLQAKSLTTINPAPTLVSLPKNAKSLTGNSPAIPDGYVMVPKEPTDEMLAAAKEWTGLTSTAEGVYIKMLAAAPQEAINALIPLVSRNEQEGK